MEAAICRVEMLGGLRVVQAGRVITRFRTYKTGALLAYLAYFSRPHPREALIEMLWPDCEPDAGRNSLSKALSSLRNQVEPPGVAPAGSVIVADRAFVGLNPDALSTDVADFEAAVRRARGPTGAPLALLQQAAERYRGELLPGHYEDWNLSERQRLGDAYGDVLERIIAGLEAAGAPRAALPYAHQAVSASSGLRQESHAALIRLYAAVNDPAMARRQYQELERILERDTGEQPALALRTLVESLGDVPAGPVPAPLPPPVPVAARESASLLAGTVTLLTAEAEPGGAPDDALRNAARRHGGYVLSDESAKGALLVVFGRASDAAACALAVRRGALPSNARIALHTGETAAENEENAVAARLAFGPAARAVARLLLAAHWGQTLCAEATAVLLRRDAEPGVALADLGLWRLPGSAVAAADEEPAERLFEIAPAGRPADAAFPPPLAAPGVSGNLPPTFTRFFGRSEERARLAALLRASAGTAEAAPRLVTLTGPGGTGKTRLSLETGRDLLDHFRGAVFFAPLAEIRDGRLVIEAVRDALALPRTADTNAALIAQVSDALRRAPSALLILDNFEQLLRDDDPHAADAVQTVRALLEAVPGLVVLVSSRQRLGLAGEREFPVAPLPTPDLTAPAATVEAVAAVSSVQLFVDRAQAVQPDFQVTPGNVRAVAELCERLEGLPLALELAGARAQVLSPAQMLVQLARRFDFLVSRKRDAVLRHRTIRAAIDWSYQLLSPPLQTFFAHLSVFRGGATLEAVEAVTNEPLALDYLAQLIDNSLVRAEPEPGGQTRYQMLETLRQFADERLTDAATRADLARRHAAYFLDLAFRARPALTGPDQAAWLDRLEADHDNLRALLDAGAHDAETALRVAGAVWRFWWVRGYLGEGRERLTALLALPGANAPDLVLARAHACVAAGALARMQADYATARAYLSEGAVLFQAAGDDDGIALSHVSLGNVAYALADYDQARAHYQIGLEIRRARGERGFVATALNNLGNVFLMQGDYDQAAALADESLALRRELGDAVSIAQSLNNAGLIARYQNDAARARPLLNESLHRFEALGDRRGGAAVHDNLGEVAFDQNDFDAARAHFAESLAAYRVLDDRAGIAKAVGALGLVAARTGDQHDEARRLLTESLLLRRDLNDRDGLASVLAGFAHLALAAAADGARRASVLLAAAHALRTVLRTTLPVAEQARFDQDRAAARRALGETAFAAAWAEGSGLSLEQAVSRALDVA